MNIRITKEFRFEMAHALYGHSGLCKNIHGHSYCLSVTVIGRRNLAENSPANGMVMDFSDMSKMVKSNIIDDFDHALVLNGRSPHKELVSKNELFSKVHLLNFQPTCENLLVDFALKIRELLSENIKLHHLCLRETPTSYAEWFAEDNKND